MLNLEEKYIDILSKSKFIDLFAGIGGFHLALDSFGAKCVFASEIDKHAKSTYEKNFQTTINGDITNISEKNIPAHDILCAGFPCQAFSISGKQNGMNDPRGILFYEIIRIAKFHQPKILLLENVKNFGRHDKGNTLKILKSMLNNINYDVHYKVLNAGDFGLPHNRERIYIIGFRKDLNITHFNFPSEQNSNTYLKDIVLPKEETSKYIITRNDIILKDNINTNTSQKPIRIGQINKGGQGERIYSENGYSITLSAYGGGIGAKTGLYKIGNIIRKLAPRECARLQGFPDSFSIISSEAQAYKQFGNSVAINVLQNIVISIVRQECI